MITSYLRRLLELLLKSLLVGYKSLKVLPLFVDSVPGAYVWLGIGGPRTNSGLHTPTFRMDEAQLPVGAALHAAVALRALAMQQHYGSHEEL